MDGWMDGQDTGKPPCDTYILLNLRAVYTSNSDQKLETQALLNTSSLEYPKNKIVSAPAGR